VANMICTDDDDFHQVNYEWVLCSPNEEECIIVTFNGAGIYGEKGVLLIKKSWQDQQITVIRRIGEILKYEGNAVNWTVRIVGIKGTGMSATAKIEICYEEPPICPTPIASITSISNYSPESGEAVKFTGYAYAGVGQEVTLKQWQFSSPYETTIEDEPAHSWINNTDAPFDTDVTLEVRNNCGGTKTSTTTITVQPAPKNTGIEIQFSDNLNGKDLIAYKAVHTLGDLWWTGPSVVDGILWTGGRCAWGDINSSMKYNIKVGDACQEREAIDGVVPEHPGLCAGDFSNGDHVIILARNPGFDFRIYSSDNICTLSGTEFSVVYLSETSGDVIDEAFTGKVCGWLGLASGSECDAFWAEFYDPIFVANYLEIQATGKDMFGNERELGWLDHVAFIASLVGSLPVFNIFPFAGIVRTLGHGIKGIISKTLSITDLLSAELQTCGRAMADVCMNAPEVIRNLIPDDLDSLREAMIKVFGELDGNKYVDDALAVTSTLFDEAYAIVSKGTVNLTELAKFDKLLTENTELGGELGAKYKDALLGRPPHPASPSIEDLNAIRNHARSVHTKDIIAVWEGSGTTDRAALSKFSRIYQLMDRDYLKLKDAFGDNRALSWVRSQGNIADAVTQAPDPADADRVARSMTDYAFDWETIAKITKKTDEQMDEAYLVVADTLEEAAAAEWREVSTDFIENSIAESVQAIIDEPPEEHVGALLELWSPRPDPLPATITPIPACKPWFADYTVLDSFGSMVNDAAKSTMNLASTDLSRAGKALRAICTDAPEVVNSMSADAVKNLRSATVKVYGDVDGNKYVDDALHGIPQDTYSAIKAFYDDSVPLAQSVISDAVSKTPEDFKELIADFKADGDLGGVVTKLSDGTSKQVLGDTFTRVDGYWDFVEAAKSTEDADKYVENCLNVATEALKASDPAKVMEIPKDIENFPFNFMAMGDELGEPVGATLDEAIEALATAPHGNWKTRGLQFLDAKVLGWFNKIRGKPATTVHFLDAKTRYAKWKRIFDDLEDYQKFTFYTMLIWGVYETTTWIGTFVIPKWFGFFPEQAAFRQRQHNSNMEDASWLCKTANDYGRMDHLETSIGLLRTSIGEAEEHLDKNEIEFKTGNVYIGFVTALAIAKVQLEMAESWLVGGADTGFLECKSNEDFFYVRIDGYPVGFSYAGKSILIKAVTVGEHRVRIYKEGKGECTKLIEIELDEIAEFTCNMDSDCVLPIPVIDAPKEGVAMNAVQFKSTTTSESLVTWLEWDFGDGDQSRQQNPSHMFWKPRVHLIQLTVTDDCGTVTVEQNILITGEGIAPGEPTPTETPDPDLPAGTATVTVLRPKNAEDGKDIVWPVEVFIYIDGQYTGEEAQHPFSFGGWKELPIGKHTFKVVAEGFQNKEVEIDLKVGDEIDWIAHMDPVGYVPPVGPPVVDPPVVDPPVVDPPVTDPPVVDPPAAGEYAIEFLIPSGATMRIVPTVAVTRINVRPTFTDNMRRLSER